MGKNVKSRVTELIAGEASISRERFESLAAQTGASVSYLRHLLREMPVALDALVEGVRQDNAANLTRTLSALAAEYQHSPGQARELVLESKSHTRMLLAKAPDDAWRNEVLVHLNTWLENPAVYPDWAALKMKNAASMR